MLYISFLLIYIMSSARTWRESDIVRYLNTYCGLPLDTANEIVDRMKQLDPKSIDRFKGLGEYTRRTAINADYIINKLIEKGVIHDKNPTVIDEPIHPDFKFNNEVEPSIDEVESSNDGSSTMVHENPTTNSSSSMAHDRPTTNSSSSMAPQQKITRNGTFDLSVDGMKTPEFGGYKRRRKSTKKRRQPKRNKIMKKTRRSRKKHRYSK